jgi:hypothetical protein
MAGGENATAREICADEKDRLYRLAEHIHAIRATRGVPVSHDTRSVPAGYTYFGLRFARPPRGVGHPQRLRR